MGHDNNSIMTNDMNHCWVCGSNHVQWHHVIFGTANRRLSDYYGLIVPLCPFHHTESSEGVHFNKEFDLYLKRIAQTKFEQAYPDLNFVEIFGKNYKEENNEQS